MSASRLAALDLIATRAMRALPHDTRLDRTLSLMSRVTDHGAGWLAFGLAGAALEPRRRPRWLAATARVMTAELASRAIKRAVPRARPELTGLPPLASTPSPRSFPSSHTADAVAGARAFGAFLPAAPLWAFATLQGASRPYLGVHFPSDVLAGAVLGLAAGGRRRLRPPR